MKKPKFKPGDLVVWRDPFYEMLVALFLILGIKEDRYTVCRFETQYYTGGMCIYTSRLADFESGRGYYLVRLCA